LECTIARVSRARMGDTAPPRITFGRAIDPPEMCRAILEC
jgi:hypothetical protein